MTEMADWTQDELASHEELMQDFRTYLRASQGLTMSTARVYVATLSAAIKKGTFGYDDEVGIRRYFDALMEDRPATAATLQAVWQHFRSYMTSQHGEAICDLGGSVATIPEAALFDLRGELRDIPAGEFVELRWGSVHGTDVDGYEIRHVNPRGMPTAFLLSKRAAEALRQLASWGYPSQPRTAVSPIIPQAPDETVPITRQRLARVMRQELIRRQQRGTHEPSRGEVDLLIVQELKPPQETPRELRLDPTWGQQPQLVQPAPAELTEEQKLALYQQWLAEAPPDGMDRMYEFASVSNTADKVTLARWRRVQWELRRPNDMGSPPQSYLSVPSPSRYAPSEPPLPAAAPPPMAGSVLTSADVFDDPSEGS